ncbi:MAG: RraA family protein [Acidobacteria bacterium]|nr:RraA family protein [Acidobacteriota bacterium]
MKPFTLLWCAGALLAQTAPFSRQYLKVEQYSQAENEALVKRFHGLRVTDVTDGLDVVGLQDVTVMDNGIKPLWTDRENFTHRIYGVAVTLRILPPQERAPNFASHDQFAKWESNWYRTRIPGDFAQWLKPDTVLVMDASRTRDVGFCGSNNALGWLTRGMRGVVVDGGCRDTDEVILEKIPVYHRGITRGIDPGRVVIESYNTPVNVGGVTVVPGDIIVADNDGVVVVPRAKAEAVAAAAHRIQDGDKVGRKRLYDKLKRTPDFTLK